MSKLKKKARQTALKNKQTTKSPKFTKSDQISRVATATPRRRRLDRSFKLQTLNEFDNLLNGEKGLYLRQRGLYSSQLSLWRKELKNKSTQSLSAKEELKLLKKENEKLRKRNETLEGLIEVQKKMAEILNQENSDEINQ